MSLVQCEHCEGHRSASLEECPWCGERQACPLVQSRRRRFSLGAILAITLLIAVLFAMMALGKATE